MQSGSWFRVWGLVIRGRITGGVGPDLAPPPGHLVLLQGLKNKSLNDTLKKIFFN